MKMSPSTTICQMLSNKSIYVPNYQRAYSWETELEQNKTPRQVNIFLNDLQAYIKSQPSSPYYFGHFLYEAKSDTEYAIVDGQQRLTTITIFVAALINRLKELRELSETETRDYQDMIKKCYEYHFSTVEYDNQFFRDYVIDRVKTNSNSLDTISKQRIVVAYDFFYKEFQKMTEDQILELFDVVKSASCTTHIVRNESEAVQMFIFQNNRGKKPSNLEIIKAYFLYNIHLYGGSPKEKDLLMLEIKNRFENIYKSVSLIEGKTDEDSVLMYTLRVYFNSLWEDNAIGRIEQSLQDDKRIEFIRNFTLMLSSCFDQISTLFRYEENNIVIHSLLLSGVKSLLFPFMIKALLNKVSVEDLERLASSLESIFIRHRAIGTRADLRSRLNDEFQNFTTYDITGIVERIDWMKSQEQWWGYWNNQLFKQSLQGYINSEFAKILLWKYENHLIASDNKGYELRRYNTGFQLEHIAPKTKNEQPENGYCEYDEEFRKEYLECLGNYLLLSAKHNITIGNKPFAEKRKTYSEFHQQKQVQVMTEDDPYWDKEKIAKRKALIVEFLTKNF